MGNGIVVVVAVALLRWLMVLQLCDAAAAADVLLPAMDSVVSAHGHHDIVALTLVAASWYSSILLKKDRQSILPDRVDGLSQSQTNCICPKVIHTSSGRLTMMYVEDVRSIQVNGVHVNTVRDRFETPSCVSSALGVVVGE